MYYLSVLVSSAFMHAQPSPIMMQGPITMLIASTHFMTTHAGTGNICRSPTAEAVFRSVVERAGMQDCFVIDSCGTGGGNPDW